MTVEKAIEILSDVGDINRCCAEDAEALDMAIKALKAQPCDDCISRTKALKETKALLRGNYDVEYIIETLKMLPSVTPKAKMGRWLMPQQDDGMSDLIYYQVRCSECGFDLDPQTWHMELHQYGADKYCPKCGARMQEEEE